MFQIELNVFQLTTKLIFKAHLNFQDRNTTCLFLRKASGPEVRGKYTRLFPYYYQSTLKFNNSLLLCASNLSTFAGEEGVPYCKTG